MNMISDAKQHTRGFLNFSTQTYRAVTSSIRLLPDFLIIGAQRCGTTSLYYYLTEQPYIFPASIKEVHFFDDRFMKGINWYRAQFPTSVQKYWNERISKHGFLTGEASPSYLLHPHAPKRIAEALPAVKLIVLLRNPVDRAYSHYWLRTTLGDENLSFEDAISAEQERIAAEQEQVLTDENRRDTYRRFSYLTRGIYVDQLKRWMGYYPKEQFLILRSEDLYSNPAKVTGQTLEFLGVAGQEIELRKEYRQYRLARKTGYLEKKKPPQMESHVRKYLSDYFKPHNARLNEYLGRNFEWDE
ncbi:MAG: hypothetical protein NVSMB33_03620 [Ktedonobacteraceae bacterium]